MENPQIIESILNQAFNFGSFGTNANFKSFKYGNLVPCTDIQLSQDLTGTIIFKNDEDIEVSKDLVIKTINKECPYSFKNLAFLGDISLRHKILPYLDKYSSIESHFADFCYGTVSLTVDNEDGVIILEQLENVQQSPQFWDHRHLFIAMKVLSKFHASSYSAKSKDAIVFLSQLRRIHEINFCLFDALNVPPELAKSYLLNTSLEEYIKNKTAKKREPSSVICLNIMSTTKTLVEYDSAGDPISIKFADLFGARYAPPGFDLMNIMYLCVDQKTRDEYWNEALQLYYDTLTDNVNPGTDIPLFVEIQKDFKFYSLLAHLTAPVTLGKYVSHTTLNALLHDIENDILSRNVKN